MNKMTNGLKTAGIIIFCLSVLSAAASAAGPLEEMRSAAEQITSIKGEFIQEKQMPILARPLIAHGYFAFQRPGSLRWEYRDPLQSVLLLYQGDVHRYLKSGSGWQEDNGTDLQSMDFIVQQIAQWLNGRFEDNPMFKVSASSGNRIVMTPKEKGMDQFIQRIELVMSDHPGVMKEVDIFESESSFTRFIFIDPQINQPISPSEFQKVQ